MYPLSDTHFGFPPSGYDFWDFLETEISPHQPPPSLDSPFWFDTATPFTQPQQFIGINSNTNELTSLPYQTLAFHGLCTSETNMTSMLLPPSPTKTPQHTYNLMLNERNDIYTHDWDYFNNESFMIEDRPALFQTTATSTTSFDYPDTRPISTESSAIQPDLNHAPQAKNPTTKVESLFLTNKQLSTSFANAINVVLVRLSSSLFSGGINGLAKETEAEIRSFLSSIDDGELPVLGKMSGPYQLTAYELKSSSELKNFSRSLISALATYYRSNYKGRHEFKANEISYWLSATNKQIAVRFNRVGTNDFTQFLKITKP